MLRAISTVGLSELETRVAKATYADDDPPKPKHVDVLLRSSRDFELVSLLEKRLLMHKWNIVLKTLVVIHRISLDGSERFMKDLAHRPHIFNLAHFMDVSTVKASANSKFIRVYSEYLAEKAYVYKLIGVSNERRAPSESQKWAMALPIHEVSRALPCLEDQFEKLLACHPASDFDFSHPIPISAVALLVKDAFRLYSILTVLMLVILEKFESMTLEQTKLAIKCAARFLEQNERFKKWTQRLATMRLVQQELLPNFDTIPSSFISLLKEHQHQLETGEVAPKKKKKKKMIQPEPETEEVEEMQAEVDTNDVDDDEQQEEIEEQPKKIKPKKGKKGKKSVPPPEEEQEVEADDEVETPKKKKVVKKGKKKTKKPSQEIQEEEDAPEASPEASPSQTPRDDTDILTQPSQPQRQSSLYLQPDLISAFEEQKQPISYHGRTTSQTIDSSILYHGLTTSRSNPNDLYSQLQQGQTSMYGQQQGYGGQQQYGQQQQPFFGQQSPQQQLPYYQQQQQLPYYPQQSQALIPYGQQPPSYASQPSPLQMFQSQGQSYQQPSSSSFVVTRADPFSNLPTNRTDFSAAPTKTNTQTKPTSSLDTLNPFASFSSTSTSRPSTSSTSRSQPMNQQQQTSQPPISSFDPFAGI